jgi:hypothetical protein
MDRASEGSLNSETPDIGERGVGLIIFYERAKIVTLIIRCERRIAYTLNELVIHTFHALIGCNFSECSPGFGRRGRSLNLGLSESLAAIIDSRYMRAIIGLRSALRNY